MDAYFFGKELATLQNSASGLVTLRLLIAGVIHNIIANHRHEKARILPTVRTLDKLYKQVPENECTTYKFEMIRNRVADELLEFNIRNFMPAPLKKAS